MHQFPIGVMLESLRLELVRALDTIAGLGVQGLQVYASRGELSPEQLTEQKKRGFIRMVKDRGLTISALVADLGHGFGDSGKNPALIEKSKRILDLAKEWDTDIVTTHIGVVPADKAHPRYAVMQDACGQLAEYADSLRAHFAVETGPETAATLKRFLDGLHSKGVSVNLDPANFVMVTGDDPVAAVHTLKNYIVHTHAKDGRRLFYKDPELVYGIVADQDVVTDHSFIELPLGEGDVDFPKYLKALTDIGYQGFLTIEREVGEDPVKDIRGAVSFLKGLTSA